MNLGKFFGSAAAQAIKDLNPRGPEAVKRRAINKAFRKAFKKARKGEQLTPEEELIVAEQTLTLPSGQTVTRTEPIIPARTSTKVGVTGVVAGIPVIQWIQSIEFPWPWLESMTNSDMFVQVATLALAYVVARMSKSPLAPTTL